MIILPIVQIVIKIIYMYIFIIYTIVINPTIM